MKALIIASTLASTLVLISAPAFAGARATGIGISNSSSFSSSRSISNSNAFSNSRSSSTASNGNQSQTTNVIGGGGFGNNRLQAPTAVAPSLGGIGADNCDSAISFGASGPGGGLSFAFPKQNDGCNRRSNARTLASLGARRAALRSLCFDTEMAQALGGRICPVTYTQR